jgi:hypothetical protein
MAYYDVDGLKMNENWGIITKKAMLLTVKMMIQWILLPKTNVLALQAIQPSASFSP